MCHDPTPGVHVQADAESFLDAMNKATLAAEAQQRPCYAYVPDTGIGWQVSHDLPARHFGAFRVDFIQTTELVPVLK